MSGEMFFYFLFVILVGAAALATLALYTRQSLLVAYIFLGLLVGPSGLKLVPQITMARNIGDMGIIFLLFLLGLDLNPKDLLHSLRNTTWVTVISSLIFAGTGFVVTRLFGLDVEESLIVGAALMFSSTIIGLKLLPTTALHHQKIGELMISILLLQDIIAIFMLIVVRGVSLTGSKWLDVGLIVITLPSLLAFAFLLQHFVIAKLFARFDKIREYVFLLASAWCLGLAEIAYIIGLPAEIGAFIAGISIAEGPIAVYIAQNLKPLRDFFLVMFFFAIGASFNLAYVPDIIVPALLLAALTLIFKPWIFRILLMSSKETRPIATEVGFRLGQASEFSLLIAYLAAEAVPTLISPQANYLIQATTLLTFIFSSYFVVMRYPTPVAFSDKLRKD